MCFSATASFSLSALLISTGIFSVIAAYKFNKNYLMLALIPLVFGVQQGIEGMIWQQLMAGQLISVQTYTYIYLFFAFYVWPPFVPMCVYCIEKDTFRKNILGTLMIVGLILGLIMYIPILFGMVPCKAMIIGHSIHYDVYQSNLVIGIYSLAYIGVLVLSLLLSSAKNVKLFGLMTLLAAIVACLMYFYAFTSVWCFFSAILSVFIAYTVYSSPRSQ